jgi:putative phosphoribosyl transferase
MLTMRSMTLLPMNLFVPVEHEAFTGAPRLGGDEVPVHVARRVRLPVPAFADRADAGRVLAAFVSPPPDPAARVLALPRGGVPVAVPLAEALESDVLIAGVRKLPVPASPEMGFGAVTEDGTLVLNEHVVRMAGIGPDTVRAVAAETRREVERRGALYPGAGLPDVTGRAVWIVDDGLATGFTTVAAARMVKAHGPAAVSLAVPVSPADSLARLRAEVDDAFCLIVQEGGGGFAVASFYRDFHDLSDAEVLAALQPRV